MEKKKHKTGNINTLFRIIYLTFIIILCSLLGWIPSTSKYDDFFGGNFFWWLVLGNYNIVALLDYHRITFTWNDVCCRRSRTFIPIQSTWHHPGFVYLQIIFCFIFLRSGHLFEFFHIWIVPLCKFWHLPLFF